MQAAGQQYVPFTPDDDIPLEEPLSLADAQRNGYRLTIMAPVPGATDPNAKFFEELTSGQQVEWDLALAGSADGGSPGCMQVAVETVGEPTWSEDLLGRPEFSDMSSQIMGLQERITKHPQLAEARRQWSECMARAGFDDLDIPGSAWDEVLDRGADALGVNYERDGLDTGEFRTLPQATLTKLQEFERSIATSDYGCMQPVKAIERMIRTELEAEFIESHRADLVRLRHELRGQ
jgi:hypothetical protein